MSVEPLKGTRPMIW